MTDQPWPRRLHIHDRNTFGCTRKLWARYHGLSDLPVTTIDDGSFESTENFSVTLSESSRRKRSAMDVGTGSILDNDQAPVVMVGNAVQSRGQRGLGRDRGTDLDFRRKPHAHKAHEACRTRPAQGAPFI